MIGAETEKTKAVFVALTKFGAPLEGFSAKDFAEPYNFFRMGAPPVMVSRAELLVAKLSAGRAQDLIDVDALRESGENPRD